MTWIDEIIEVFRELGGIASYDDINNLVLKRGNKQSSIKSSDWKATIRQTIFDHSSDSKSFRTGKDIFYSVKGLGGGVWGLRESCTPTSVAPDTSEPELPQRVQQEVYRVLRDTVLARSIKALHKNVCQICGNFIEMIDGQRYSETHHIQPLGRPHNGPLRRRCFWPIRCATARQPAVSLIPSRQRASASRSGSPIRRQIPIFHSARC